MSQEGARRGRTWEFWIEIYYVYFLRYCLKDDRGVVSEAKNDALTRAQAAAIKEVVADVSEIGLQRVFENMQGEGAIPGDQKFDLGRMFVPDYLRAAHVRSRRNELRLSSLRMRQPVSNG